MIKVFDTEKKQYYPFSDYMESLTNDSFYGLPRNFVTSGSPIWKDLDNNEYSGITIGDQMWLIQNFRCTKYADGSDILLLTEDADWIANTVGACCAYNNDNDNIATHGLLYNYHAVINAKGIAHLLLNGVVDTDYRVPTEADYDALIAELGGSSVAGGVMKEADGFNAVFSGQRSESDGSFSSLGSSLILVTSSEATPGWASCFQIGSADSISSYGYLPKKGMTLRLVKDL